VKRIISDLMYNNAGMGQFGDAVSGMDVPATNRLQYRHF